MSGYSAEVSHSSKCWSLSADLPGSSAIVERVSDNFQRVWNLTEYSCLWNNGIMSAGRSWKPSRYSWYKNGTEVSVLHLIPYKHKCSTEDFFRMDTVHEAVDFAGWDWPLLPLSTVHEWGGRGNGTGGAAAPLSWLLPLEYSLEQPYVTSWARGYGNLLFSSFISLELRSESQRSEDLKKPSPIPSFINPQGYWTWKNCWWVSVKGGDGFRMRICLRRVAEKNLIWINKICELKVDYQCRINGWIS